MALVAVGRAPATPLAAAADRLAVGIAIAVTPRPAALTRAAVAGRTVGRAVVARSGIGAGNAEAQQRADGHAGGDSAAPPVRFRVRTTAQFVPTAAEPLSSLLATFDRLQAEQLECLRQADGRPIHRVKITSPFDPRLRYNLYACLTILPPHQERHIWQAERVLERLRSGR